MYGNLKQLTSVASLFKQNLDPYSSKKIILKYIMQNLFTYFLKNRNSPFHYVESSDVYWKNKEYNH